MSSEEPKSGLGDKVATVTEALGFKKKPGCGCHKRHFALNKVDLNQNPLRVAGDIVKAVISPSFPDKLKSEEIPDEVA